MVHPISFLILGGETGSSGGTPPSPLDSSWTLIRPVSNPRYRPNRLPASGRGRGSVRGSFENSVGRSA